MIKTHENQIAVLPVDQLSLIIERSIIKGLQSLIPSKEDTKTNFMDIDGLVDFLKKSGITIPKSTIYKLTAQREIPCSRIGKKLVFKQEDILLWLEIRLKQNDFKSEAALIISNQLTKHNQRKNKNNREQPYKKK